MQLPMFIPEKTWSPPSLDDLPSWEGVKRIGIDTETYDPYLKQLGPSVRRGGFIAGVSFAFEDGPCYYLPVRHQGGGNLDEEAVFRYLRDNARIFRGDIVGANLPYDLDYLASEGVQYSPRYFRDVQIADPLIYELHDSYTLEDIALRHGLPGKDEAALLEAATAYGVHPKAGLWKLPSTYVGVYAEQDAVRPLQILRRQERLIEKHDLWDIYNLESKVLPVLVKLRRRGVRVNMDKLEAIENWTLEEEAKAFKLIRSSTNTKVGIEDVWNATKLEPALTSAGIKVGQTEKTGKVSITSDLLKQANHPVATALLWARKVNKLRTTFAASIREHEVEGRIHCTFHQIARESDSGGIIGARWGRMSCVKPNLQQQPKRDEFSATWRAIYEPEPGAIWACNDYSQQEPRWTTHYAYLLKLEGSSAAVEQYRNNPDMDNHQFMADLTGLERDYAKPIYLGICYGEGGGKLCDDLGLPTRYAVATRSQGVRHVEYFEHEVDAREYCIGKHRPFLWRAAGEAGQKIIDQFNERAPYIKLLAKAVEEQAKSYGMIHTADGRLIHFPEEKGGGFGWGHKGLNRLVQGSAAGQMKKAIVILDQELPEFYQQLLVHDEDNASVESPEIAHKAARIMEEVSEASVPFVVKPALGPSWGEIVKAA